MAQTEAGSLKAKETIYRKYGKDYFREMGRSGGKAKVPKGFARMDTERLREVSIKGGTNSRRTSAKNT